MTPFEKAGYTKDTKFRVLRDYSYFYIKKGDIVTLYRDSGSKCPWFKTEDGRKAWCWIPNMVPEGCNEELEVYEDPKKELTPFQKAGYTKDTKFRVLRGIWNLRAGDIVTLCEDNGQDCPWFKTEDGSLGWLWLPNMAPLGKPEELEVYEEPKPSCDTGSLLAMNKIKDISEFLKLHKSKKDIYVATYTESKITFVKINTLITNPITAPNTTFFYSVNSDNPE